MAEERLQKVLAAAGVASRRASEALIAAGRVRVDGRVAKVGESVNPMTAQIEVDGMPIGIGAARAYVALHKPAGVTSTTRDRHAETTVLDLIPQALVPDGTRLYPVGRLDLDSEGLLLLTNDGAWAERVLHPRFGVQREYAVGLAVALDHEQAAALRAGIPLEEGMATFAAPLRPATAVETRNLLTVLDPPAEPGLIWYRALLAQGWKRQLRRMFAAVGSPIQRLVRVRIGSVRLDDIPAGRARRLRTPEIKALGAGSPTAPARPAAAPRSGAMRAGPAATGPGRASRGRGGAGRAGPGRSGPRQPAPAEPAPPASGPGRKTHAPPGRTRGGAPAGPGRPTGSGRPAAPGRATAPGGSAGPGRPEDRPPGRRRPTGHPPNPGWPEAGPSGPERPGRGRPPRPSRPR